MITLDHPMKDDTTHIVVRDLEDHQEVVMTRKEFQKFIRTGEVDIGDFTWYLVDCIVVVELNEEEYQLEGNDIHLRFSTGSVVKWLGDYYIISDSDNKGIHLIPFKFSNCISSVSNTFPNDPRNRLLSVQIVADTIDSFIMNRFRKLIYGEKERC